MDKKRKLIGVYDYTVILTYIGLCCSVIGMTQAIDGRFRIAIVCLARLQEARRTEPMKRSCLECKLILFVM